MERQPPGHRPPLGRVVFITFCTLWLSSYSAAQELWSRLHIGPLRSNSWLHDIALHPSGELTVVGSSAERLYVARLAPDAVR